MLEIKLFGRGGQGLVAASQILGLAFFKAGLYPQCFSVYGGERRGAPVTAFLRVDQEKILLKCGILSPDELIYLDPSLVRVEEIKGSLKPGGRILINSPDPDRAFGELAGYELGLVDAAAVARSHGLGKIVNTSVLGAYCGFGDRLELAHLLAAMEEMVPVRVQANQAAARQAGRELVVRGRGEPA